MLTTTDNTATNPPTIGGITRQQCVAPPGTLSAPATVSPGGWPVGVGLGLGGVDVIETFFPVGAVTGTVRLGFLYTDPNIPSGADALLTRDGSANGRPCPAGSRLPATVTALRRPPDPQRRAASA